MPKAPAILMVTFVALLLTMTRAEPTAASVEPVPAPRSVVAAPIEHAYSLEELLAALRLVETGGLKHEGRHAVGDGGKAIGPYQIHRNYWKDSRLPGRHEDCRDPSYAREVVMAYWRRYCPQELARGDVEVLARVHNGGPEGHKKGATQIFWRKVEAELKKARAKAGAPKPAPKSAPSEKTEPKYC